MSAWRSRLTVDALGRVTRVWPYRASDDSFRPLYVEVAVDWIKRESSWARDVPMPERPDGRWM